MKKQETKDYKTLIPIIIVLGFIPLITHAFYYDCGLSEFDWFPNNVGKLSDYFLAWKMIALIIVGAVMAIILSVRYYKKQNLKFENTFYALLVYSLFVAMSALFSSYKHWVVLGSHQMFESVWVLFSYVLFCCYTYAYVQTKEQLYFLLKIAGIGSFILMLIGTLQFLGFDLFNTTIGRMIVTNPSTWKNPNEFHVNVAKHTVYTTLYNQNFLSFYFGIAIPVILGLIIATKKMLTRIILVIAELLAVLCLIGAKSSSGWIALLISFIITFFVLLSRYRKGFLIGVITCFLLIGIGIVICFITPLGNKVSALFIGTSDIIPLQSIDTTNQKVCMNIDGNILQVDYLYDDESGQLAVHTLDADGNPLPTENADRDATTVKITNTLYRGCTIAAVMYGEDIGVQITLDDHVWLFVKDDEEQYYLINQAGKMESYKSASFSALFKDDAFSGRGHIWDGTIPILPKYIFVGSGANTFMFAYPQNDYIYRAYMNTENALDVKPHNMYLQQWVENGMIALLAFLIFVICYIISSIRIFRKISFKNSLVWISIGIFTGIVCYLIVGLANDSNVCTAPVFWVILGLGMAINRILKEEVS